MADLNDVYDELANLCDADEYRTDDMSNEDKIRLAQVLLNAVIDICEEVADDTDDANAKAYMVDHLKIMASENHGFVSRDFNLDQWIERLEKGGEEDEES